MRHFSKDGMSWPSAGQRDNHDALRQMRDDQQRRQMRDEQQRRQMRDDQQRRQVRGEQQRRNERFQAEQQRLIRAQQHQFSGKLQQPRLQHDWPGPPHDAGRGGGRSLLRLIALGLVIFWIAPALWGSLSSSDRAEIGGALNQIAQRISGALSN